MRATILDGSRSGDTATEQFLGELLEVLELAGWERQHFPLARMKIGHCRGCFGCWLQTPGLCLLEDDARDLAAAVINSDLAVLYTPVTFGGYSSVLKQGLDRLIGLVSPFFMKVSGEVHHQPRYERYPALWGVGVQEVTNPVEKEIFSSLVARNAINLHAPGHAVTLLSTGQDEPSIRQSLHSTLAELGEKS